MDIFEEEITRVLNKEVKLDEIKLSKPPSSEMGDYAFACFPLAKSLKKDPKQIAQDLSKKIKPNDYLSQVTSEGAYLNFFVNKTKFLEQVMGDIKKKKDKFGSTKSKPKKVMVEFSSPNTNKPLHLGHLRNIAIGEATSRIFEFNNHKVVRACIVNDRGIHIIKSMLAYMELGGKKDPDKKPDHYVGDFYVMYSDLEKKDATYETRAKDMLKKWEQGDKPIRNIWKKMNKWVYQGFNETYKKLGITFDKIYYESELYEKAKDIVLNAHKKGIFETEEGAIIARLEKYGLPDKVLIRSDGTSIYMTQDIYLAQRKFDDYKLDESIYVVATEQNLHFKQLFKILELLGKKWAHNCYHLAYGMVYLPEGKMKSREGLVVDADDIISEMEDLAKQELNTRYKLSDKELSQRSTKIALAGLKFFLLKHDAYKDMTYDPKESISFQGETGPYIQYTYARICSIIGKSRQSPSKVDLKLLDHKLEWNIAQMLLSFPKIVLEAQEHLKPSLITRYLLDLGQIFNEYYHEVPILRAEDKIKQARLELLFATKQVLKNGLNLLGISEIEQM